MENKTFELVPVLDTNTGKYVVRDFDKNKAIVEEFINGCINSVVEIHDEITFKTVKTNRTEIRKKVEVISKARKDINALLLGEFNAQLKEIEKSLTNADETLKAKVDAWNEKVKGVDNTPHVLTLVIKGYDAQVLEKLKTEALKLGLRAEIK